MMYKFLLLVSFLASALAVPLILDAPVDVLAPENGDLDVSRKSCAVKCLPYIMAAIYYAACLATCSSSSYESQPEDFSRPEFSVGTRVGRDATACLAQCRKENPFFNSQFNACVINRCVGNDRTVKDETSDAEDEEDECVRSCSIHMLITPLFKKCVGGCEKRRNFGRMDSSTHINPSMATLPRSSAVSEEKSYRSFDASTRKVEARDFLGCYTSCLNSFGGPFNIAANPICIARCTFGRKLNNKSLDYTFSGAAAQPNRPMQITNILSQVIKKQQELLQMIQSCKCAKPVFVPVTPLGPINSDKGLGRQERDCVHPKM